MISKFHLRYVTASWRLFLRRVYKISKSDYWLRHVCRLSVRPSVRPSVRLHEHNSALTTRKFWFRFNMTRITAEDQCQFTTVSCGILLRVRLFSKAVQKIKTHMLCPITFFFRNSCSWWDNVEKTDHRRECNMTHSRCMLDIYGYGHTLIICNTYCFLTATTVTRTRFNVALYVQHCVSRLKPSSRNLNL
jgi:hypothetical protein